MSHYRFKSAIHDDADTAEANASNQSYRQAEYRRPVIQATQAQAPTCTRSASTGNASTSNQFYRQRKHRQPVIQTTQAQATSYTRGNENECIQVHRPHKKTMQYVQRDSSTNLGNRVANTQPSSINDDTRSVTASDAEDYEMRKRRHTKLVEALERCGLSKDFSPMDTLMESGHHL